MQRQSQALPDLLDAWDAIAQDVTLRLLPWRGITPGLDERLYRMREALDRARVEVAMAADRTRCPGFRIVKSSTTGSLLSMRSCSERAGHTGDCSFPEVGTDSNAGHQSMIQEAGDGADNRHTPTRDGA